MGARDPRSWMWARAQEMLEETERLRRQFFGLAPRARVSAWEPPVDVFATARDLWIVLALPGVEPRRVEVRTDGRRLIVLARRDAPRPPDDAQILRMELPFGWFERQIELPPGSYRLLDQLLEHGCLRLHLAREEATP